MTETVLVKGAYEANTRASAYQALEGSLARFSYDHALDRPILIASIRKSGSHLVQNFAAHFVGLDRTRLGFVGPQLLARNYDAISQEIGHKHWLYTGHVKRDWVANSLFQDAKVILVVRDPYTQVISRAVYFFHPDFQEPLPTRLRAANASVQEAVYYAIFGSNYRGWHNPSIVDEYSGIAAAWYDRADGVLRYEDLTGDVETAVRTLRDAADKLGWGENPQADERIRAAIVPDISATFWRKKRTIEISPAQKATIEHLIPGIRAMFGYE